MAAEEMHIGARNPRAVAEAVLGRPVDWSQVPDERQLISEVLATPYDELFDPANESPLYLGLEVDEQGRTALAEPRFLDLITKAADRPSDLERKADVDLAAVRTVADLKAVAGVSLQDIPVRSVTPSAAGGWNVELGKASAVRRFDLASKFSSVVLESLWSKLIIDTGWTPPGSEWADIGSFFHEAAEYFDPVQAGLADCWLVSAMSSVAWALPFSITQRTRATGTSDQSFVNLIELTNPANGQVSRYEMTDQTLVYSGTTTPKYSHSSEAGELWPQIIEKAYANFRAGTNQDHPDLTALNYGDCVGASAVLTGRQPQYTATSSSSTTDLINLVKAHSVDHRTINPMTCWTYGTSSGSPDGAAYSSANIVANHCYSVLGWVRGSQILRPRATDRVDLVSRNALLAAGSAPAAAASPFASVRDAVALDPSLILPLLSQDYLVLRNPWGYFEPTTGELGGLIQMKDVSFWRAIDLDVDDGVFAIDLPTFKKYFAGIGVAL